MAGYRDEVVRFLKSKGLNDYAIAGILGNIMQESSFDPTSENGSEGAIGFCQWEGDRRTALQQWALHHHGADETDAQSQLEFMWHELNTGYTGVLHQLQNATSAGQAAQIFDVGLGGQGSGTGFENSSGDATRNRINYADQFYSGSGPNPQYNGPSGGGGGMGSDPGATADHVTRSDLTATDDLGKLFKVVPALKALLNKALDQDWTTTRFENAVQNSDWYKNHSQSARAAITQRVNDPASWQQDIQNVTDSVRQLAHQLGMQMSPDEIHALAIHALVSGNVGNQAWLTERISNHQDYSDIKTTDNLRGGMAATSQQLSQLAADYGMNWAPAKIAQFAQNVLDGTTTIDTYKAQLVGWAKGAFPGLAKQIDGGQTVRQLSDPYVQSMSNLLEVNPGQLDVYTPKIRRAMQGVMDPKTKERTPLSISEFEDHVRQDPRWQYTQNARDTMSQMLLQVGADFGFGPEG